MDGNNHGKKQVISVAEETLSSLPFWEKIEETPKFDKYQYNFHAIHTHTHFLKIIIGYSPHIYLFATNLWGQMEETKIDLF